MTSIEKSQSFISVVMTLDIQTLNILKNLEKIQRYLEDRYSDYEILLIVKKNAQNAVHLELEALLTKIPAIRYLQLTNNAPNDVAFAAGLENAIGDFIVLYNPLTDPIENIQKSVDMCKSGSDVVVGTSQIPCSIIYSLVRPLVSRLLTSIDYRLPRNATEFRCLSRRAANAVMATGRFHQRFFMQIQKSGFEAKELPYTSLTYHHKTFLNGFREVMHLMVFNSSAPLRLMSVLGLVGSTIACLVSLYALAVRFLQESVISGWASTVLLISFFSLLQFIILSFISEYLARLLTEQHHSQAYSIVFEKNSLVMVNQDRINVLETSTNDDINKVQTGRNK